MRGFGAGCGVVSSSLPLRPGGGANLGTVLFDGPAGRLTLLVSFPLVPGGGEAKVSRRPGAGASLGSEWSDRLAAPKGMLGLKVVSLLLVVDEVILGGGWSAFVLRPGGMIDLLPRTSWDGGFGRWTFVPTGLGR